MSAVVSLAVLLAAAVSASQTELVITIAGSKEYHRPDCALVRAGGEVLAMTRAQAEGRGLKPHADCDPAKTPPPEEPATGSRTPAKPVHVYLDRSAYYHREHCAKLGPQPKRVLLDEAAKKHWPCRECKPPIRKRPRQIRNASPSSLNEPSHVATPARWDLARAVHWMRYTSVGGHPCLHPPELPSS